MTQTSLRNFTLASFVIAYIGFIILPFTSMYSYGAGSMSGKYWWSICLLFIPVGMLCAAAAVILTHEFSAAVSAAFAAIFSIAGIAGMVGFYLELDSISTRGILAIRPYAGFWITGIGMALLLCCSLMNTVNAWRTATEADDDLPIAREDQF